MRSPCGASRGGALGTVCGHCTNGIADAGQEDPFGALWRLGVAFFPGKLAVSNNGTSETAKSFG